MTLSVLIVRRENNVTLTNSLWVERYRPKKLSDLILPDSYRADFEQCIKNKDIANFLLFGPAGSGKTTLARILASSNGVLQNSEDNLLQLNGSAKDSRGIGFVSEVIEPYLKIPPSSGDKNKIVFIDECDFLSNDAMHALRGIIEKYSSYGRFIFTCNYVSKIPDAITSRTQGYEFRQTPIEYITGYCKKILDTENIKYKNEDVKFVIDNLYPDIRKIVNTLQKSSITSDLIVNKESVTTAEKKIVASIIEIVTFLNEKQYSKIGVLVNSIIKDVNENEVDYRGIYQAVFNKVGANCKIVVNKYANEHSECLIPQMHFTSMVFKIIETMKKYNLAVKS
jgi:replication factor C small subunit